MQPSINDFPRDLLALVLTFLPVSERLPTADLVCKAFHHASKHPLCWDTSIKLSKFATICRAVKFFTKHECIPDRLLIKLSRADPLSMLSCLSSLRTLTLERVHAFIDSASITAALSPLNQLERLYVDFHHTCTSIELTFPNMPRLHTVSLVGDDTAVNLDCARVLHLSDLTIHCKELREVLLPASITRLKLLASVCYPQALSSVTNLPNLELLNDPHGVVLSRPAHELRFSSTLTTYHTWRPSVANPGLIVMTHLTCFKVQYHDEWSAADVAAIASLPSLTSLHVTRLYRLTTSELAPFRRCSSLKHLHVEDIPPHSLAIFALPNITSLELVWCHSVDSLAPLAACANLTYLHADVNVSEQDAEVLAGLTKLETLTLSPNCQDCFTHICRLPKLRVLRIECMRGSRIGQVALQALVRLAPTLEELELPHCYDCLEQTLLAVSQLTKLKYFSTISRLTAVQVSAIRNSLPRLYELRYGAN